MTERRDLIKLYEFYFVFLTCLIIISRFCEQMLYQIFGILEVVIIFDIEMILIIIFMTILYFILHKDYRSPSILFIHSANTILISHIILIIVTEKLVMNTIVITLIGLIIFAIIIPYDKEYKILVATMFISLFVYISVVLDELILGLGTLGLMCSVILISNESFRNRIISVYQTIIVSLKRVGSW